MAELFVKTADALSEPKKKLTVILSNQLIHLLSEQMYSSPAKAIEELVVNAYDADADLCRITVPQSNLAEDQFIAVYDDGTGMDAEGLATLWHVGASPKRESDESPVHRRRLIGKFGIGKLATYALANRITYITKRADTIRYVACDYRSFGSAPEGPRTPVELDVREIKSPVIAHPLRRFDSRVWR